MKRSRGLPVLPGVARDGPHVLHVVRTLGHGGMERNLRRVAIALEARGVQSSVLLLHDQSDILEFPPSIAVRRLVSRPHDPRLPARMAELIWRLGPTIIHARNGGAWFDTALARALLPWIPLVFSYHGMDGASVPALERLKFRSLSHLTTQIFAVSHAARDVLVEAYGLPRRRVGVILNGVDLLRFSPRLAPRPPGRLVVGAVGRLFAVKNYPLLLRAFRVALDAGFDAELRIAGDGPETERVDALAVELGLGASFTRVGSVEDVPNFLRALDVFALSSDREANPNALLEAMATGLACVSTAAGGARELLAGGEHGLLVLPGDTTAFGSALVRLLGDAALRAALGASARRHAEAWFGETRMFDAYEALYRGARLT